jgi:hypothetical protein
MKPTKRDIMIVEHFVKKTTKGYLNEGTAHNQIKYNMTTLHKQLQKLNQVVQSNPEFKDGDPIKSGIANVLVAFNKFFQTIK